MLAATFHVNLLTESFQPLNLQDDKHHTATSLLYQLSQCRLSVDTGLQSQFVCDRLLMWSGRVLFVFECLLSNFKLWGFFSFECYVRAKKVTMLVPKVFFIPSLQRGEQIWEPFLAQFPIYHYLNLSFSVCVIYFFTIMCLSEITSRCFVCFVFDLCSFFDCFIQSSRSSGMKQHSAGSDVKNVTCLDL